MSNSPHFAPTFTREELSLLKLLVLQELQEYDDLEDTSKDGNIYSMCKQLVNKLSTVKETTYGRKSVDKEYEIANMFYQETLENMGIENPPNLSD